MKEVFILGIFVTLCADSIATTNSFQGQESLQVIQSSESIRMEPDWNCDLCQVAQLVKKRMKRFPRKDRKIGFRRNINNLSGEEIIVLGNLLGQILKDVQYDPYEYLDAIYTSFAATLCHKEMDEFCLAQEKRPLLERTIEEAAQDMKNLWGCPQ